MPPRVCACRGCRAHAGACGYPSLERHCQRCGGFRARFRQATPAMISGAVIYRSSRWKHLASRLVARWVRVHGWRCPGYRREPHDASRLTVDHRVSPVDGGAPFDLANLTILCQSCNSRKALGAIAIRRRRA